MKRKYSIGTILPIFLILSTFTAVLPISVAQSMTSASSISAYGLISYPTTPVRTIIQPLPTVTSTPNYNPTPTSTPIPTATPIHTSNPTGLHVVGNKLLDSNNNQVILRGWIYQSVRWFGDSPLPTEQQFINMAAMGCNCVNIQLWTYQLYRGSFGSGGNNYNNPTFLSTLDSMIAWATAHNLYVILSPWMSAGPLPDGHDTNDITYVFNHYDSFSNFLSYMAFFSNRYSSYNNIIYVPMNEPLDVNDANYSSYMQQSIDTIRTYSPNAIVNIQQCNSQSDFASGEWNNLDFSFQQSNPINRPNIMFSLDPYYFHTYPKNDVSAVAGVVSKAQWLMSSFPVMLNEVGGDLNSHEGSYSSGDTTWLNNMFAYIDANAHGGYTVYAWEVSSAGDGGALSNWNGALTTLGNDVKTYYLAHR